MEKKARGKKAKKGKGTVILEEGKKKEYRSLEEY